MSSKKGVISYYYCSNQSCENSDNKIEDKQALIGTNNKSFKTLSVCPKCQAKVELINFISGTLDINKDNI